MDLARDILAAIGLIVVVLGLVALLGFVLLIAAGRSRPPFEPDESDEAGA